MDDFAASASETSPGAVDPVRTSAAAQARAIAVPLPADPSIDLLADELAPQPSYETEYLRTRVAWSKLMYLVTVLAVLLGIAQFVPYTVEQIQYSLTRGRERAQYEMAGQILADSPLEAMSHAFQRVTQRIAPSVVQIDTMDRNIDNVALQSPFNSFGRRQLTTGQGSGVIVDTQGYIVTNWHVIRGSQQIKVVLSDGRQASADLVGYDAETDIAVIKISQDNLIAAEWGDSDEAEIGSMVWALGSPFGLKRSVTSGILSGKNREGFAGTPYQKFLQSDVAVNPGNSGGPLVDVRGRVIGINTAIVGESYQGISFAVPSNIVRRHYKDLMGDGVKRGWLGVQLDKLDEETRQSLKLARSMGVLVKMVVDQPGGGSPALKAGVMQGDVILKWNNNAVNTPEMLTNLVAETEIGSSAELLLLREGQELTLTVEVGRRPVQR